MTTEQTLRQRIWPQVCTLINDYSRSGRSFFWEVNAEIVHDLVDHLGWNLRYSPLSLEHWGYCDRTTKTIHVANNLAERLEYPDRARLIETSTLAHELGHVVLGHTRETARAEREANIFANQLLCPWPEIEARPELAAMATEGLMMGPWDLRQEIYRMAEYFQVTFSFMVSTLVMYRVVERMHAGLRYTGSTSYSNWKMVN